MKEFMSVVLADTEDTWGSIFARAATATNPKLVLYSGAVGSACGFGQAAMGPFYCRRPARYIDLSFYDDLRQRYGAPGDFAQAYVLATRSAITSRTSSASGQGAGGPAARRRGRGQRSVGASRAAGRLPGGPVAHHANRSRQILEKGDVEEALNAASVIGDDRMQRRSRGYVTPDSFTHGSSRSAPLVPARTGGRKDVELRHLRRDEL